MQYQTLSKPDGQLTFETVVPKSTSTRHVAAAAFYHCLGSFLVSGTTYGSSPDNADIDRNILLVLATKNLLKLEQSEPYGSVVLGII